MRRKTLALVTIGQSPRDDVTPDMLPLLSGIRVIESGALDELTSTEIAELAPRRGEGVLVSRLRGGGQAALSEERVHPLVQAAVDRGVQSGADVVLVMCTGNIPGIGARVPVFMAESLAHGAIAALVGDAPLTVVVPEPEQAEGIGGRWEARLGRAVNVVVCDPYSAPLASFTELAAELREGAMAGRAGSPAADRQRHQLTARPSWVFLDCIGYSEAMADAMRAVLTTSVLTARGLAARLVSAAL